MYILTAGTQLGRFKLINLLGKGGMGEVWRALDPRLGREVAIKVLPPDLAKDPDLLARFERESKILAALNHPFIAHIYEAGEEAPQGPGMPAGQEKVSFLVMEFVEGRSLSEILVSTKFSVLATVRIARQIARALSAAHKAGIIHRDLKPANIMVTPQNVVKVLDFGLARPMGGSIGTGAALPEVTIPGMVMGTAAYLSPEQVKGNPADTRTDIWAFGCVLYQMLAGKRPFDSNSVPEILAGILRDDPQDLGEMISEIPQALKSLVKKCLAKDPQRRPQSAQEIASTLKALLHELRYGSRQGAEEKAEEPEYVADASGSPRQASIETVNRYLKMTHAEFPQLSATKRGPSFVEVQHRGIAVGILLASKPNSSSDLIAFISPLFRVPSDNLVTFYKRLLILSNGHTDVAQFALDTKNRSVNLTCIRGCAQMEYKDFLYTLDAISNTAKAIGFPLKAEFRIG
jgi:serine/threonine protein kinase